MGSVLEIAMRNEEIAAALEVLAEVPGVSDGLAARIIELTHTGHLRLVERLRPTWRFGSLDLPPH